LGEVRNVSAEGIGRETTRNFYTFFKLTEIAESKISAR